MQGHTGNVKNLVFTKDNKYIITGSADYTIGIWHVLNKQLIAVLRGHKHIVNNVRVTLDNKYIISTSLDKTLRV